LRRLVPRAPRLAEPEDVVRQGLFVDVETTGLDVLRDEIIELAMVPFTYTQAGQVLAVGEAFQGFHEPSRPIPPEITAITGIEDSMVSGQTINPSDVAHFAGPASLVIAHNAAFDRKIVERFSDVFTTKPWACSMSEIDWAAEGYEGVKLAYLAAGAGFFYERHRAEHDCLAAIELLARVHPRSGRTGLDQLLERARRPTWRIWAENSPFELKDLLKARGYRWNAEGQSGPRSWYLDVSEVQRDAEMTFLKAEIYQADIDLRARRVDAYDRFSARI
jgi:DNA polymerase-3 subunit epsilon